MFHENHNVLMRLMKILYFEALGGLNTWKTKNTFFFKQLCFYEGRVKHFAVFEMDAKMVSKMAAKMDVHMATKIGQGKKNVRGALRLAIRLPGWRARCRQAGLLCPCGLAAQAGQDGIAFWGSSAVWLACWAGWLAGALAALASSSSVSQRGGCRACVGPLSLNSGFRALVLFLAAPSYA